MDTKVEVDPKLIEAFNLMWGAYPGTASLVHKSKTIMAVNDTCLKGGRQPGMICSKWTSPDNHRGCRANDTLASQKPLSKLVRNPDKVYRVYWLPIPGYPDFYVHFTTEMITLETAPSIPAPAASAPAPEVDDK